MNLLHYFQTTMCNQRRWWKLHEGENSRVGVLTAGEQRSLILRHSNNHPFIICVPGIEASRLHGGDPRDIKFTAA
ncbi:hypothetical protein GDO81_025294 [Engystomops pustulosus]|uniref:Uncharacterized protein n=1 Tax=Engystomops pustulosus TaxID=76066 RepID=A0AAV6ZH37_ENGPU|nr:hypothetical protein GDO81_025294 [Engystomops pustulosus]